VNCTNSKLIIPTKDRDLQLVLTSFTTEIANMTAVTSQQRCLMRAASLRSFQTGTPLGQTSGHSDNVVTQGEVNMR